MASEEVAAASYEDLALIEDEFDRIDVEISPFCPKDLATCAELINIAVKQQWQLSKDAYKRRADVLSKIPNFWTLVLEASPPEVDSFIHPRDSKLFAESLKNVQVSRFELDENTPNGSPRSFSIRMEFDENDTFEDKVLEKKFWYRRASDGWSGLVSEPVKIHWKKGKDLSEGLTDKAVALFEARKKSGDMLKKDLPEYKALQELVEHWNGANTTFFTFFGFVSSRRWVSAEEHSKAAAEAKTRFEKRLKGEKVEEDPKSEGADEEDNDADINDDTEVEVFENGDDLATTIAEDMWPNAIKYFTDSQEQDDEELSELDFEEMEEDDDDEDGEPIDIRALVQDKSGKRKRQSDGAQPAKAQKK